MATFDIAIGADTATFTLEGTAPKQKVLDTAEDAARYFYPVRYQLYEEVDGEQVPISFDDLTLAQRKAVIAREFVFYMLQAAKAYHATNASETARASAIAEAADKYALE